MTTPKYLDGDGLAVLWNDILIAIQTGGGGASSLPKASSSTLGCIKVGSGLQVDSDGVLSVSIPDGDSTSY